MNPQRLFIASCVALAATSMSFGIRGDILADFEEVHVRPHVEELAEQELLEEEEAAAIESEEVAEEVESDPIKTRLGVIGGAAFLSFGLAIIFGGPLCDLLGMGNLLRLAAAGHLGGTLLTIFAPTGGYYLVVAATLIIGVANGLVEAACNPLIATIFPEQKSHKLTIFHAWFPGGIVIGGLLAYVLTQMGFGSGTEHGWQIKMALILVPAVIYTVMIIGQKFPPTERVASGVSFGDMILECFRRPLFILLFIMMWFTAATELGPGQWIANIFDEVMADFAGTGILLLVWGNGLMFVLRQFCTGYIHRFFTPVSLIAATAPFAAIGLYLTSVAGSPFTWFLATGLLYLGVAWWWPTMLGITSERLPKTGAMGLAIIGGVGAFSTSLAGPIMGYINDTLGPNAVLPVWSSLPVVILIVFGGLYFYDKSHGGYQIEKMKEGQGENPLEAPVE